MDQPKPKPPWQSIDARDVIGLAGLALLAFGLWFVWPPLAAIIPGAVLTYVAIAEKY
jgi:hypothetical protein